jgi:transcriptional repressor NrdR
VVDSREQDEGQVIRRRRSCPECGKRFTTVEEATLAVIKRSGVTEPFSRQKVINGVRRACQGRPVDEDALAQLAQTVEETIRATGSAEVPAPEVGLAILGPLRALDEVAYLRFASVYRSFSSIEDFEKAISELRIEHRSAGTSTGTVPAAADRLSASQQPHGITKEKGHSGL